MDRRMEAEVKNLMKVGLSEDFARLSAGVKFGNEDVVNDVLYSLSDEQEMLKEAMAGFKLMGLSALEITPAEIIKPDASKVIFFEINQITNQSIPIEIPQQQSSDAENIVIEIGSPSEPVYRMPVGKT
jgi:hypothetical protein